MPKRPMRITHRVLSFRWFVGLLTYPFMRRGFSPLHKRIASAFSRSHDSPSNDRFSPRARFALHGKQYFRNTATFRILPSPLHSMIHRLQTERRDSFRVRDSHPIPLFSEQECVSDCSGRAFATKAMLFSLLYARLFYAHKKTSPALLSCRQKKSRVLCIFGLIARKNYGTIQPVGWLVGWLVGCKNRANYLHFYNYLPCLRTFPFQNLHPYLTAIRGNCKEKNF